MSQVKVFVIAFVLFFHVLNGAVHHNLQNCVKQKMKFQLLNFFQRTLEFCDNFRSRKMKNDPKKVLSKTSGNLIFFNTLHSFNWNCKYSACRSIGSRIRKSAAYCNQKLLVLLFLNSTQNTPFKWIIWLVLSFLCWPKVILLSSGHCKKMVS